MTAKPPPRREKVLARAPGDLDVDWAQRVVNGSCEGAVVSAVEILSVDVGTTTRVRLAVDHDGPEDFPRRWFVKLPSGSWKARAITALPRLPQTEVRFYNEIAGLISVLRPTVLAAVSALGRGYTLVLADVTEEGATPGRPGDALSADQAGEVVDVLAQLHAQFWEAPLLDRDLSWLAGPVRRLEDGLGTALATPLMKRGLRRAGDAVPQRLHAGALNYAKHRRRAMRFLGDAPRTLVHHDCHPGNLYWKDGKAGLLDWQLVRLGEGVSDVAYLLAIAMDPSARRDVEADLLRRYADGLANAGGPALDLALLEQRYRAHTTYAFEAMVVTLAIGGLMPDAVAFELVRRAAAAVDDADAFAAVASGL
jgi:aminoglycoside/choline kinase family phosphotransferase